MRKPPTLARIAVTAAVLLVLHLAAHAAMSGSRVMETLLSPHAGTSVEVAAAAAFLALRLVTMVLVPGWVLARLALWAMSARERRESPEPKR